MDWKTVIFQVVGGLGLFLMGMKFMSEGMQKVAGDRLRKIIGFLTSNRFMAIGVGFLVTIYSNYNANFLLGVWLEKDFLAYPVSTYIGMLFSSDA